MKKLNFILLFSMINSCIELEIAAPSFPSMAHYFLVSAHMITLTVTYNLVGFCLGALVYGPLSDCYGRRKIMLLGNGLLVVAAMACVMSPTINILLLSRFFQGVGAATSAVIVSAIITDCYNKNESEKVYGMMNAVFTILMACSPILGGVIHSYIGWRGNYGIVALISCISWVLLFFFLPETHKQKITYSWRQIIYACKKCITNVEFMVSAIMPSLLYGCYLVFVSIAPFIYMQTMKLTMIMYVVNQAIIIAVFAIGSLLIGALIKKLGRKKIIIISSLLLAMSICLLLIAHTPIRLTIAMSLFSLSFAWIYPIVFSRSMMIFPGNKGLASSVIMSLRYFLCAGLTGLAATYFLKTIS